MCISNHIVFLYLGMYFEYIPRIITELNPQTLFSVLKIYCQVFFPLKKCCQIILCQLVINDSFIAYLPALSINILFCVFANLIV